MKEVLADDPACVTGRDGSQVTLQLPLVPNPDATSSGVLCVLHLTASTDELAPLHARGGTASKWTVQCVMRVVEQED